MEAPLERPAAALVASVERAGVAGVHAQHEVRQGQLADFERLVVVVAHQRPREATGGGVATQPAEAADEVGAICVDEEYGRRFNPWAVTW